MEINFDNLLGQLSHFIPNDLFDKLWSYPANTPIETLKKEVVENLPKEYPGYDKIMDILNKALS